MLAASPSSSNSVNTGTKAAWIAASANRLVDEVRDLERHREGGHRPCNVPKYDGPPPSSPDQARDPGRSGWQREYVGAGQPPDRGRAHPAPGAARQATVGVDFTRSFRPWGQRHSTGARPGFATKSLMDTPAAIIRAPPNGSTSPHKEKRNARSLRGYRRESPLQERREDAPSSGSRPRGRRTPTVETDIARSSRGSTRLSRRTPPLSGARKKSQPATGAALLLAHSARRAVTRRARRWRATASASATSSG